MDLITSVAKTASTPSLLLHKNAVYREELRRKKVYLEKSLYRALGKIKHEEHILKEKRAQSWDSSDSFQLRLPGFRFRANGDYKKSVSRMREERLWESLREVRKRRSLPGKESSVNIIDTSIVDGKGPPEAQTTVAEVSLAAVAAATVAAATEVAAVGARSDNRDEVGSFLHPLNTVPYTVRKVQCQLGLHYRPRAVAFLEGGNTLSPMTYKDSAMLLHKALKKPDLEDLAKGLRTKWKDREEPENSNSNSITITIREAHQESPLLRPSIGRSHVKRRCFACRYGQQCCLDEKGARHAITVVDRPRWQLVPAGKLVPQARRRIKLFSSSSDSGVRGSSQSTQLSLTNSLPVVMDRITATPLSYHQSSQMYVGLRKASDHRHSASLLATHLEDDQEDVILKIAGTNRSLSGCSSSKEDSFVNIIPSRHLGLNELKKKIKDENEVLKSKVDGFLKTLSKNTKRV